MQTPHDPRHIRTLGFDVGAETIKVAELLHTNGAIAPGRRWLVEHHKEPAAALGRLIEALDWSTVTGAAATGRMSRLLELPRVPTQAALSRGVRSAHGDLGACSVVSVGSHGFAVLELRGEGHEVYRENSRCSQGTGNFLRQLVERFDLGIEEASALAERVTDPAPLSGRCPVILKTDMTHLANKGEDRARILAGLFDAVCENVQVLLKPRLSPPAVLLVGGVSRSARVRDHFRRYLEARDMRLVPGRGEDDLFLEAEGAAWVALAGRRPVPAAEALLARAHGNGFETVPALKSALGLVRRMPAVRMADGGAARRVVLGFDIGSTGSKAVALDEATRTPVWEGYTSTLGSPVQAARSLAARFLEETGRRHTVLGVGATGSGREIVGSLMASAVGKGHVFVLNEIAAHAEGALHFDREVDTIFEIGGQDAKYIRLDGGRIIDAAMNEACSAGTGSFIEEQGRKFKDVADVRQMGDVALGASCGVSLGQHCSVFMAEVIDEAVSSGVEQAPILAGIYDSIVQNYLNRVKGARSVGQRIFCQGMPFAADALAAAVARQTGRPVVVPPNPGTIGALGIALLAARELPRGEPVPIERFLSAEVDRKDTFICMSTRGCGEPGNRCRIDRIRTVVVGERQRFIWGGSCSLYDAGTGKRKLPDLAPDPFRERRALVEALVTRVCARRGKPLVALTDEFALKGALPFFATFVHALGFDVSVRTQAGQKSLKRGIEEANIPFCAPMQLYQGVSAELLEDRPDVLLLPRLRELPRFGAEPHSKTCPIVQGSPDIVRKLLGGRGPTRLVTARIDMGPGNYGSDRFKACARDLANDLGREEAWEAAFEAGRRAQDDFGRACRDIGERALGFARQHGLAPVVVLGRPYTIHNDVLNSNVPTILRDQGALAIPVDCYAVADDVPVFQDTFWGYSQMNLRAAHQIRRTDGVYSVYCSNYSCGPDSFNLHFYAYIMDGKPFTVIETDGHSGDAGTKTRIEAFLYCVDGDRRLSADDRRQRPLTSFRAVELDKQTLSGAKAREETILIPRMGPGAEVAAELMKAEGMSAEALPLPTREALRLGRRHTSGKECVPMTITTGSLLDRLERERYTDRRFAFFMPTADGPCRFGAYNVLHKIILEKTGWKDRVRVIAPEDQDYFAQASADFSVRIWAGLVASDLLLAALHDVRPAEREPGAAQRIYDGAFADLKATMGRTKPGSLGAALLELPRDMFGIRPLMRRAAADFAAVKDFGKDLPTVAVVGELYVRLDPFANDFVVQKLEARGLRAQVAFFTDWMEYLQLLSKQRIAGGRAYPGEKWLPVHLTDIVQSGTLNSLYDELAQALGWGPRTLVEDAIAAASPYLSPELMGEAVLTLGAPTHEHAHHAIDGVVSVGPHECMPNKVAEAQLCHVAEEKGLLSLTLPLNGDPVDPELLDRFAFQVKARHAESVARGKVNGVRRPSSFWTHGLKGRPLMAALGMLAPLRAGR